MGLGPSAGFFAALALCGSSPQGGERRVTAPPPEVARTFSLAPFYGKYCDAGGIPVVASAKVSDPALLEAACLIDRMLAGRDDIRRAMAANRVRFAVMAPTEMTTDIPEHAGHKPRQYWDKRARGLGASRRRPAVSCGEENLLGYPGDPYATENILIHEMGHAIHEMGLNSLEGGFDGRLQAACDRALSAGLWKGKYAATNRNEYWAEGVQSWFDTNREEDHDHNHVNTRDELKEYDGGLAKLLAEVFGDGEWRYRPAAKRRDEPHLKAYDPAQAPKFAWPPGLSEWYRAYESARRGDALPASAKDWTDLVRLPPHEGADELRSGPSGAPAAVLFVNRRRDEVNLLWIGPDGARKSYGKIRPGGTSWMETFVSHVWLVTDGTGKALHAFRAEAWTGRALIPAAP